MVESLSIKVQEQLKLVQEQLKLLYEIIAEKTLENIRDLGEITLRPEDFARPTIENRLERASCTIAWTRLLYDRGIVLSDLIPQMTDTLVFLHDIVKDKKYKDGEIFIRGTLLHRIVKSTTYFKNFPKDAIPTFELFIREMLKEG